MSSGETDPKVERVLDALELLAALRPFEDTGRDPELLKRAWNKAWTETEAALEAWLEGEP